MYKNTLEGVSYPDSIPIQYLFDLDIDSTIWCKNSLYGLEDDVLPLWMVDDTVHRGIVAFLNVKHCQKELQHLSLEKAAMYTWIC